MLILLPIGSWQGLRTYRYYQAVETSVRLFREADQLSESRDQQAAINKLDECLAVNPEFFPAYELKADIYADTLRQPDKALAILQEALRHTDDGRIHLKIGKHYLMVTREFKKAQSELAMAAKAMPLDDESRTLLRIATHKLLRTPQ